MYHTSKGVLARVEGITQQKLVQKFVLIDPHLNKNTLIWVFNDKW